MSDYTHYLEQGWAKWNKLKKTSNAEALEDFTRAEMHALAAQAWTHFEDWDNKWVKIPAASRHSAIRCAKQAYGMLASLTDEKHDDYRIYWVRGYAYLTFGNRTMALKMYTEAFKRSNQSGDFDLELLAESAHLRICEGKIKDANDDLDRAIDKTGPTPSFFRQYQGWAQLEYGEHWVRKNKLQKAKKKYQEAITTLEFFAGDSVEFQVFLAAAHAKMGEQDNKKRVTEIRGLLDAWPDLNEPFTLSAHEADMKANWHYDKRARITKLFKELYLLGW